MPRLSTIAAGIRQLVGTIPLQDRLASLPKRMPGQLYFHYAGWRRFVARTAVAATKEVYRPIAARSRCPAQRLYQHQREAQRGPGRVAGPPSEGMNLP